MNIATLEMLKSYALQSCFLLRSNLAFRRAWKAACGCDTALHPAFADKILGFVRLHQDLLGS